MAIATTHAAELSKSYGRCLWRSLLFVTAIHLLFFYFAPPFQFKPYELLDSEITEIIFPDEIVIPPAPRDVTGPVVAIEPAEDGEEAEDVEIPENVFGEFRAGLMAPAPESERAKEFIVFDEQPFLVRAVLPAYPELSRQAGVEGQVLLRVLVDTDGTVHDVSVLQSDVTPAMDKAAIAAAWHFIFRPAKQGAVCVKAQVVVPVVFKLH